MNKELEMPIVARYLWQRVVYERKGAYLLRSGIVDLDGNHWLITEDHHYREEESGAMTTLSNTIISATRLNNSNYLVGRTCWITGDLLNGEQGTIESVGNRGFDVDVKGSTWYIPFEHAQLEEN